MVSRAWKNVGDETPSGPLPWKLEDGTTPESARRVILTFLEYTHDREQVCRILGIGTSALVEIERTPLAVSRDVGRRSGRLKAQLARLSPAHLSETVRALEHKGAFELKPEHEAEVMGATKTNVFAARKMADLIKRARMNSGLTQADVAAELKCRTSDVQVMEKRVTPKAKRFFRLCELLDVAPEEAGFVDFYARRIEEWRKKTHTEK